MQNYQRLLNITLTRLASKEKAKMVAILGARQVGKTTLLNHISAQWKGKVVSYLGDKLEDALLWRGTFKGVQRDLEMRIGTLLEKITDPLLLTFDEIQKIPEAFNNLKVLHDTFKLKIKIVISGSSSLSLLHRTSESLGGRIEIVTMYPLSFTEIFSKNPKPVWMRKSSLEFSSIKENILSLSQKADEAERILERALFFGFFPESYLQEQVEEARLLHQNYHQTYIEKDVRDLREVGNVLDFDLVWKMIHRMNGQLLNTTNVTQETGLSFNTVKKYISLLSASFNTLILSPFTKNIRKRLVKSSKVYSVDLGFFNDCTGVYGKETLIHSGLIGPAFESIMISEFFKQERSFWREADPYFFRTSGGAEVDLVIEKGLDLYGYEFKYGDKIRESDLVGLRSLKDSSRHFKAGFLVTRSPYPEKFEDGLYAVPWWYFCFV